MSSEAVGELITESISEPTIECKSIDEGSIEHSTEPNDPRILLSSHPSGNSTRPGTPETSPEVIVHTPSPSPELKPEQLPEQEIVVAEAPATQLKEDNATTHTDAIEANKELDTATSEQEQEQSFESASPLEEEVESAPAPASPPPKKSKKSKRKEAKEKKAKSKVVNYSSSEPQPLPEHNQGEEESQPTDHNKDLDSEKLLPTPIESATPDLQEVKYDQQCTLGEAEVENNTDIDSAVVVSERLDRSVYSFSEDIETPQVNQSICPSENPEYEFRPTLENFELQPNTESAYIPKDSNCSSLVIRDEPALELHIEDTEVASQHSKEQEKIPEPPLALDPEPVDEFVSLAAEVIDPELAIAESFPAEPVEPKSPAQEQFFDKSAVPKSPVKDSVIEASVLQNSVVGEPIVQDILGPEQTIEEVVVEGSTIEPISEEPVVEEVIIQETITEEPIVEEPTEENTVEESPQQEQELERDQTVIENPSTEELRIDSPALEPYIPLPEILSEHDTNQSFHDIESDLESRTLSLGPERQPRPASIYSSTVEDFPETGETPTASVFDPEPSPEPAVTATPDILTMALQDRALITSQLADALALFTSFDESIKTLVTRLQSNENNVIAKKESQDGPIPPPSAAPFHVPHSRNSLFHGRFAILSQIFGMWRPQQRCRIAVVGLGGLGKTEIIVEFIYRARQVSPNTPIYWFDPDDIRSKETATSSPAGMQLEEWLRGMHDPGTLLVVDCGDRSDLFEPRSDRGSFIDRLRNFEGTVILISRNARHGSLIAKPHQICEVNELEPDACVNLMCDNLEPYAHDATNEKEVQEMVKALFYIPRAIVEVTKVINNTEMTVAQFYSMYSSGEAFQLRLYGRIDGYSKPDQDLSVVGRGVFDLRSFRKSQTEASRLLFQIYYLGGKAVPCALVATDDPLNKILLMIIVKAHFMIIEDTTAQTFSIHPMVYLAMRKALAGERPLSDESDMVEERKWYDEAVLAFSKHYPDASVEGRKWWKECFGHLITGYKPHNDALRVAIATIYHRESAFFKRKGIFSEALKMASLAKSVLPDPVPSDCLAIVQDQVTLLDFLAKYREVREMLRGLTMEVGHPGNLWKKSMLAKLEVADCASRYDSAIETFRQVRTAGEAANADKLDLANAIDDLSMALMQKGKYREAAVECRKALAERTARLGSSHTDSLSSCHNLAEILHKDGKLEEAHRYIQDAVRGRETALGADHPETLHSKVMRARIQISKAITAADYDDAEAALIYCIDRLSTKLSPSHPIVMTSKSEIARIMFYRGKYETAEQMNQAVLAAREQGPWLEPATHPDTMTSRNQLTEVIRFKDGSKAADNLSERCLTERTVVLTNGSLAGDDFHPDQLTSLHNRAVILSGLGQHLAALQKIDLALLGRKAILGEHHPDYFISMTWKGEIMRAQLHRYQSERTQTLDTIENLHKQAYEGLSWLIGSEHQSSLQAATHMGLAKRERGSPASSEAEGLFRQIHCGYQHNLGDFHPETLKSKGRLAEAMRAASPRHHLEAKKLWRDSCGGLTRIYGFEAHITNNAFKGYEKFMKAYPDP